MALRKSRSRPSPRKSSVPVPAARNKTATSKPRRRIAVKNPKAIPKQPRKKSVSHEIQQPSQAAIAPSRRILLASSEVHPFSKTGGLADMVGALGKALAQAGHQVAIVTPLYRGIKERYPEMRRVDWMFDLPLGTKRVEAELWAMEPMPRLKIYFIHKPDYYDRAGLYNESGTDYPDNAERFIFFSKCVAHLARYLPWRPDVVHVNDWQAGLVPVLIRHQSHAEGWGSPPTVCLTIHNLAYQGIFPRTAYDLTNLPLDYFHPEGAEFYGLLNCLKAGIAYADVLTTVSPRYAREITTEEFGCALDGILRKRQSRLVGILNGVDYEEWNTTANPYLKHPYSIRRLAGKLGNKLELQKEMGLPVRANTPLFGTITRLTDQKGVDIELGALEEMLRTDMQLVLLGSGAAEYEHAFRDLAHRFPTKVAVQLGYNQVLSHRIEAACDFYLMPSKFEPCGLNQMYSLRYGTIPIVRVTGGLDDTVMDVTENSSEANGIKFMDYSARALSKAMRKALAIYEAPALLGRYRRNAMNRDFSWQRTVGAYLRAYGPVVN
ncbi:MAG: glycogen synthase GlgA [Verrucomicrobia bacterium]|nr:glycogen synthase GlgA [Verrucomicrobiota bacterium]